MRSLASHLAIFVLALASGCASYAQQASENLSRIDGRVPDELVSFFDNARSAKSATKSLEGISNASLRAMSDAQLAAVLRVLDGFEGEDIFADLLPCPSADRTDLTGQVFRVLAIHTGPAGATAAQLDAYQQALLRQDPAAKLSPADQGHVKAILTRMPTEGSHLIERFRGPDKVRIRNWSTRQLTPGDVEGLLDYVHALTGTKAATGSTVQFIAAGGMTPDLPAGTVRPDL